MTAYAISILPTTTRAANNNESKTTTQMVNLLDSCGLLILRNRYDAIATFSQTIPTFMTANKDVKY